MVRIDRIPFHLFLSLNLAAAYSVLIVHKDMVNSVLVFSVFCASSILILLQNGTSLKFSKNQVMVLLSIAIGAVSVLCLQNIILGDAYDQYGRSALGWSSVAMISNLIWFSLGLVIANSIYVEGRAMPLAYTLAITITISLNIGEVLKGVVYSAGNNNGGSVTFNHLFVASNVVVLYFYCFSAFGAVGRFLLSIIYLFLIFSLQGRSALLVTIITVVIYLVVTSSLTQKLKGFLFVVMLGVSLEFINLGFSVSDLGSRFNLSDGILEDVSVQNRLRALIDGIEFLPQQFLIGNPTIFITHMDGLGSYMHNFISTLQIYGFPFTVILSFGVIFGVTKFHSIIDLTNPSHTFIFLVLIYSLLQMVVAQSILFKLFWFILGVVIAIVRTDIVMPEDRFNNVK